MTDDRIRNMTQQEWQTALTAAEAYGRAIETGDQELVHAAHQRALAAGCVDSGLNHYRPQET